MLQKDRKNCILIASSYLCCHCHPSWHCWASLTGTNKLFRTQYRRGKWHTEPTKHRASGPFCPFSCSFLLLVPHPPPMCSFPLPFSFVQPLPPSSSRVFFVQPLVFFRPM